MSIRLSKALCLHAQADDLKFLNPARNRIGKLLGHRFSWGSFGDQKSEADARLLLRKGENDFVIIFAHGGSDYIRGGEYVHRITREIIEAEKFLTVRDLETFRGKVVFCLSCDSNGLARPILAAGAQAFVGFGDIPFNRYDVNGNPITNQEFRQHAQQLIANAVTASLEKFIQGKITLEEAVAFFRLFVCQDTVRFVQKNNSLKQRREIAALLLRVKDGIRYHGAKNVVFTI